ncbi:hypothetical protein A8B73_19180 [Methylosinus sp. 3S-1]|nr:hypothetical protein A8B73_19180 [Methylosinus sp. 3S-1]
MLDGPARRAVIYAPVAWHYATLDGIEHIAGLPVEGETNELSRRLLRFVFPDASRLAHAPTRGESAIPGDPEAFLALHADAALSWSWMASGLRALGAPVVPLDADPARTNATNMEETWRLLADVSRQRPRFDELARRYRREMNEVIATVPLSGAPPRVAYFYQLEPVVLAVSWTRIASLLEMVGAQNIVRTERFPQKEELMALAPDVVVLSGFIESDAVASFLADPAFRCLPAVRTRRVYREPMGGARMEGLLEEPLMLQWLVEILYPEKMAPKMREKFSRAYEEAFGVALSEAALDEALSLEENARARDGERFARTPENERR